MLYIDNIESHERVRMKRSLGATVPLHSTAVGKACLAFTREQEREQALERLNLVNVTGKSITLLDVQRLAIADVKTRGWATDAEENERDIVSFGTPILDRNGYATAAVSVSTPRYRVSPDVEAVYVEPLLRATAAVSRILGYKPAPMPEKARAV